VAAADSGERGGRERGGKGGARGGGFSVGLGHAAGSTPMWPSCRNRARAVADRAASATTRSREIRRQLLAARRRGVRRRNPAPRSASAGGVAGLCLCYTSRRCAAPRLKSLLRPPRCSSSPQAAAPPASPHTIAPPASPHASGAGSAEVCARAPTVGAAGAPVEDLVTLQRRWRRAEREGGGRGLTRAVGMGEMREKPGIEC
jgi:hypothetical protein